ncbi:MAG TPA: FAD-dependent monooxygenase [Pseudorhodoferax sp.]|nr:FAD-dependent monooxygenase [Pseudorhodoferax sp.]
MDRPTQPRYGFSVPLEMQGEASAIHPVLVVGAGPVGLTLALTLERHGVPVVLLEAQAQVCDGSRALGMSRRTLEIWAALGAVDRIAAHGRPWDGGKSYWRDREILRFRMADDPRLRFRPMLNLQQCHTEQYLVDAVLQRQGIDLRWQQGLRLLTPHTDHVAVVVDTPQGDYVLRARHVVACDGARSTVREAMGLRLEGSTHDAAYLIADIRLATDTPMGRRCWFDPPSNPGSTVLMHGQPDGVWRLDYQLRPQEDQERAQSPDAVRERIRAHLAFIGEAGPWELLWSSLYRAHSRALAKFRQGRVVFAGDAAHLMPIFGIRGLNSGVEDAWNLGCKLAMVHHGLGGEALLDSYCAERRRVFVENALLADRNARFMSPSTQGTRIVRDAVLQLASTEPAMADIINPRQASHVPLRDAALDTREACAFPCGPAVGEVLPDLALAGERGWLQARLGRHFTVLVFGDLPGPSAEPSAWQQIAPTSVLKVLRVVHGAADPAADAIADPDGALHAAFGAAAGTVYLVRPDHHIAARWTAVDAATLAAALHRALAREGNAQPAPTPVTVELAPAEQIYRAICAALGDAGPEDGAQVLARIALNLAVTLGDAPKALRAIEQAAPPRTAAPST